MILDFLLCVFIIPITLSILLVALLEYDNVKCCEFDERYVIEEVENGVGKDMYVIIDSYTGNEYLYIDNFLSDDILVPVSVVDTDEVIDVDDLENVKE